MGDFNGPDFVTIPCQRRVRILVPFLQVSPFIEEECTFFGAALMSHLLRQNFFLISFISRFQPFRVFFAKIRCFFGESAQLSSQILQVISLTFSFVAFLSRFCSYGCN
jgi:hypothetical protein